MTESETLYGREVECMRRYVYSKKGVPPTQGRQGSGLIAPSFRVWPNGLREDCRWDWTVNGIMCTWTDASGEDVELLELNRGGIPCMEDGACACAQDRLVRITKGV